MIRLLARSAFLLSGVAGLTFEIVWIRHLGLAVGATTLAIATITAAYMGGLALGSHLGGKVADRLRKPLAAYGALELGLALVALALPALTHAVPNVDAMLFNEGSAGLSRALVRFVVAVAVLIVPTTVMGATLPILARAVTDRLGQVGREVGTLYAINIAGAMLGAWLAGFVWIPTYGLSATNHIAVGIDLLVGAAALAFGVKSAGRELAKTRADEEAPRLKPGSRGVVAVLAATGASAMALQILWTRGLSTALGPSTYAFSAIVCAYLAGLALGGGVASRLADRTLAIRAALSAVLLGTGAAALFGINVVDDLPSLLHGVVLDEQLTIGGLLRTEFALAALTLLPATVGMGAIFPLTITAVVGSEHKLGAAVGIAYAVNTMGAIVGSFAGVFVLLPLFGVEWGLRIAALGYVAAGAWLAYRAESTVPRSLRWTLFGTAAAVAVALVAWPRWDVARWTAGLYRLSMTREYYPSEGSFEPAKVIFHRDGMHSTVTVEEDQDVIWIKVGGKVDGSSYGDMPTQVLSGLLPMMLHPNPKQIAVIGCGTGVTVGATLQGEPERVTLVELEGAVLEGAKLFAKVNHAPWDDPRLAIVEDDGRNFLRRGTSRFDVIISEPSNPWMTGAASLFTQEFFRIAETRLNDDGLFLQWLQIYELAPERIQSVLKTFNSVFPHVHVFTAHVDSNDLLIVGSKRPLKVAWETLARRFVSWAPELERAELTTVEELLALLLVNEKALEDIPADIPLNTDDNALVEFGAPRDLLHFAESDPDLPFLEQMRGKLHTVVKELVVTRDVPWEHRAVQMARGYLKQGMLADAIAVLADIDDKMASLDSASATDARILSEIANLLMEDDAVIAIDEQLIQTDQDYARVAALALRGREKEALSVFKKGPELSQRGPLQALLHGYLLYRDGDYLEARAVLKRADEALPDEEQPPAIAYYLAREAYRASDYGRALEQMNRYRAAISRSLSPSASAD